MRFVLDASVALSWCFHDEATPETMALLEKLRQGQAYVPSIWPLEMGNILIGAQRKHRISSAGMHEFLMLLEALCIIVDEETSLRGFREILNLASAQQITTYDAAYLELAMRLGVPIATKDKALREAAVKLGVAVLI